MSRSLPLAGPAPEPGRATGESAASGSAPVPALRGRVEVFDPALLAVSRDLRWLERQGVEVARAGLATEPDAFVANARVAGLLQAFGDGGLPATLVNGDVLAYGRYPTRAELVAALTTATDDCCAPGSGCC